MGKHKQQQQSGVTFKGNAQGCMWNILEMLDYSRWHNVKKRLPHKRRNGGKNSMGIRNAGKDMNIPNADEEEQRGTVAEMENSWIEKQATKSSHTTKSSGKARIKALIARELYKLKGQHRQTLTQQTQSQLTRTESIHRLESADLGAGAGAVDASSSLRQNIENSSDGSRNIRPMSDPGESIPSDKNGPVHNQTVLEDASDKSTQALLEQKLLHATDPSGLVPSKEFLDALHIVNMNREFFLKILQDPETPWAYHFHHQRTSSRSGLSKSGSFPLPGRPGGRDFGPIEFKGNQKEIESHSGSEGKLQDHSGFTSTEDVSEQSKAGTASHRFKQRGENQVAIRRFKDLKQKIKYAIRQSKKERLRISMDAILHKVPPGHGFSKDAKKQIAHSPGSNYGWGHSEPVLGRQFSYPNKSLERYTRLFESSFNQEVKCQTSETLKLRTEDVGLPCGSEAKSLRRILSLPDFKSYFGIQNEDSCDGTAKDNARRISTNSDEQKSPELPLGSENHVQFAAAGQNQIQLVESSETYPVNQDQMRPTSGADGEAHEEDWGNDDLCDGTTQHTTFYQGPGIKTAKDCTKNLSEPSLISVLDSNVQEDFKSQAVVCPGELLMSEDSELEGPDSVANQQHESIIDSPEVVESRLYAEEVDLMKHLLDSEFSPVLVDKKDKAKFSYVRDVIKRSGVSRNELLETWQSIEQLVDPSVFEQVEGCLPLEPECSENEEDGSCNRLLLFDLINEVLMEIYERSLTYCPLKLSSLSRIHPVPVGYHVLEEVWTIISWYISWEPDPYQTLDYVVTRDLAKDHGWMNLQFEAENLGLELEDWIFDDLLDELCI